MFGPHLVRFFHNYDSPDLSRELFGLTFKNPVGLSAGFDKNGEYCSYLSNYGFSFIEVGSLSPDQQTGGKQRVFRFRKDKAVVNRTEVYNKGVRTAISNFEEKRCDCILVASIIPDMQSNKDEEVIHDYQTAFSLMYDFADMFTVNISIPNESGVLTIQDSTSLADVMDPVLDMRLCYDTYKPILIKVSPDLPLEQLDGILDYCMLSGVDGIIAGGPTRKLDSLTCSPRKLNAIHHGLLSGAPLYEESLKLVRHINEHTKGRFPIIACGGIMTPEQASEMIEAGASLVQINTGLIFEGPRLVKRILKHLSVK